MRDSNKVYYFKVLVLIIAVTVFLTVLGFALYKNESAAVYSNSLNIAAEDAQNNALSAAAVITDNINDTDDYDYSTLTLANDKYSFCGKLSGTSVYIGGDEYVNAAGTASNMYVYISNNPLSFYSMRELSGGVVGEDEIYAVYSVAVGNQVYFKMQNAEQFFAEITKGGFVTLAIAGNNGRVYFTSGGDFPATLDSFGIDTVAEDALSRLIEVDGETAVLAMSQIYSSANAIYYYAGVMDNSVINAALTKYTNNVVASMSVAGAAIIVLMLLFVVWTFKTNTFLERFVHNSDKYYVVKVDYRGNYLKGNDLFKENFAAGNIFESIIMRDKKRRITNGDNFMVSMIGKDGKKHMISFLVSEVKKGYKMVGINVDSITNMENQAQGDEISIEAELHRRYDSSVKKGTLLIGMFAINNLRNIEAMFGKAFSDLLFVEISGRIKSYFDVIFVLAENKIGVMVTDKEAMDRVLRDLKDIMNEINRTVYINDNLINVGCKAGFVIVDKTIEENGFNYAERCANAALRRALSDDTHTFFVYHESQRKHYVKYKEYNFDIKKMLEDNSFSLEYQPQYSLSEKKIVGFEALFRIKKSLQLDVKVSELISYAERTGKMILLGDYIFDTGMKFAKSIEGKDISVSLNVSPIQFMQAGFIDNFLKFYKKYELKPGSICVEITETFLMNNYDEILLKLDILNKNGIKVHLDDFGVAYSSFLYLKKLPISSIKIDQEFVRDIIKDDYSYNITKMIVQLSHQLELECICEGVETEEQKHLLEEMKCDIIQGYLIGKSLPDDEARSLL